MKNQAQLITYVDRLSGGGFRDLAQLLAGPLRNAFGGVHVLPFFNPIDGADAGFDPIDHTEVDSRLGSWEDVRTLAARTEMIADMILKRDASRMLVYRAGVLKDEGKPNTTETSVAKLYATESAVECANLAIQVHGGAGYVDDYPVERYLRDARVTTLYEGTSQIQKMIIGRAATGINAMTPMVAE